MKPVAIIGGGITGLTAAFRLHQKQIPFILYESSDRVGGVIRSFRQEGYLAEFGPNTILETSPKILEVIRGAGLEKRMLYSDPKAIHRYLARRQRTVAMPASLMDFLKTELFSPWAKAMLFREPFVRRWDNRYEESVAQLVLRRLGQEFLDYAIDALVAGVYAGDPYRLSVRHAFPKLYALEQKYGSLIKGQILGARERKRRAEVSKQDAKKISFDEGLQVFPDTLYTLLKASIQLHTPVMRLKRQEKSWLVQCQRDGVPQEQDHAAVLFTGPAYKLGDIELVDDASHGFTTLAGICYPPVATVVLGFRREDVPHPLDGFGMLIPKVEGFHILGTLFSSSLFPNRAPQGHVTLTTYIGGLRSPELALKEPDELYRMTVQDLRILLNLKGQPTFQNCVLYKRAIPQYEVGYGKMKQIMDELETSAPGLFFAGHYRHGISISDSIVSGYDAADRIASVIVPCSGVS